MGLNNRQNFLNYVTRFNARLRQINIELKTSYHDFRTIKNRLQSIMETGKTVEQPKEMYASSTNNI